MKRIIAVFLVIIVLAIYPCNYAQAAGTTSNGAIETNETKRMSEDKANRSISMLNYLTVLACEITESKGSRAYLEEAYSDLVDNILPGDTVDEKTQQQLLGLLDTIEDFRMVDVKRERLEYTYEQSKAQTLRAALPNPITLLAGNNGSIKGLITKVIYMTIDSASGYAAAKSQAELKYLQEGWKLEDVEAEAVHGNRKSAFSYMMSIVRDYHLDGDLALSEDAVDTLVRYKNSSSNTNRLQFLEDYQNVYQAYGGYWLLLAETYYKAGDYNSCLESIQTYEDTQPRIFRYDREFAKVLPMAIAAAEETLSGDQLEEKIHHFADLLQTNIRPDKDYDLRYIDAVTYSKLYILSHNESYLNTAYRLTKTNINLLAQEQRELNNNYYADIKTLKLPTKNLTKDQEKINKNYNKELEENRKIELPPISESLLINCNLMDEICSYLQLSEKEMERLDHILHGDELDQVIFLTEPIDNTYWFSQSKKFGEVQASLDWDTLTLPADILSEDSLMTVMVTDDGKEKEIGNWKIDEVNRNKSKSVNDFSVSYTSKDMWSYTFTPDSVVKVNIKPAGDVNIKPVEITFKVKKFYKIWKLPTLRVEFEQAK